MLLRETKHHFRKCYDVYPKLSYVESSHDTERLPLDIYEKGIEVIRSKNCLYTIFHWRPILYSQDMESSYECITS